MKTAHFQIRVGWPRLPTVVQELASLLDSDDWARRSTADEKAFYYILGMKALTADQQGEQSFETESVPLPRSVKPPRDAEVHAQVATVKSPAHYVTRSMARLEASGVDVKVISTFVAGLRGGDVNWASLAGKFSFSPGSESLAAFCDLLRAVTMELRLPEPEPVSEAEKRQELEVAVEKVYLGELSGLYESLLRRAGSLEALTFSDPLLNEASRSYLYGFFRATVLLSSTALETCLREAIGSTGLDRVRSTPKDKEGFYRKLVKEAVDCGVLGRRVHMGQEPVLAIYSAEIFKLRNRVAHEGYEPQSAEAVELLTKARQVIASIRGRNS